RLPEMKKRLVDIFQTRTRDQWFDHLRAADVAVAPVLELAEAVKNEQIPERRMVVELDHPGLGKVKQLGPAVKLSSTPASIRTFSTPPGHETDEVLRSLGYSDEDIAALRGKGVVE